jgi:hypothetical protein
VLKYLTIDHIDPSSKLLTYLPPEIYQDLLQLLQWEHEFTNIDGRVKFRFNPPKGKRINAEEPTTLFGGLLAPVTASSCEHKLISVKIKLGRANMKNVCLTFALTDQEDYGVHTPEFWMNVHEYQLERILSWPYSTYCRVLQGSLLSNPVYWVFDRYGIERFALK